MLQTSTQLFLYAYHKGGVTTLQHHSSEKKNVPHHKTVTEYIILTIHVACMYSYIACLL